MEGLLLVDKPEGISSFGVVAKVRGILRPKTGIKKIKVGHTGTLDPAATGLLVLAIGSYTKKVPQLIKQDKTYFVTITLGKTSTTGDKEGEFTSVSDAKPTKQDVSSSLNRFVGEIMQTPPIFSAIKINGQRAYNLARQGKEVKMEPRPVTIYAIDLIDYSYPTVKFTCNVSSGTYIRSLAGDIGNKLGTGAYMSDLRRTKIGEFDIKEACVLQDLNPENIQNNIRTLTNSLK
jgi:tRNA pseudouridine55 synthase